jgi:hypothetical protein
MKTYTYKISAFLLLLTTIVNAQTFDKKIEERFKVVPEVEIIVNADYTDVEIETWNKNEVSVVAIIEVSGIEENEANKILKNWEFEALGNKNTVKIKSASNKKDYNFNNNFTFPEVKIPEINFYMPNVEFPKIPEFPEMKFDYEAYKKDTLYLKKYKMQISEYVKKFNKSDWKKQLDSIRNTPSFIKKMEELKIAGEKMANKLKETNWYKEIEARQNSEEFKRSMAETKKALEEATFKTLENRDEILEQVKLLEEANKVRSAELKRLKEEGKLDSLENYFNKSDSHKNYSETTYFNFSKNHNSNLKIKKYLKIKVPKKVILNLNVRHGKVTVPESNNKMSVNMEYGSFVGGAITGTENNLTFINTPVTITTLNSSTISLKNVKNASLGSVENLYFLSNLSDVVIDKVGEDVSLNQKFGNLNVNKVISEFKNLNLTVDYAKVTIPLGKLVANYTLNTKKSRIITLSTNQDFLKNTFLKVLSKNDSSINGNFSSSEKTQNSINLTANYSTITVN